MTLKGYHEANNGLLELYDPSKPKSWIIEVDANNLYGHSMIKPLPTEILDWVNQKILNPGIF